MVLGGVRQREASSMELIPTNTCCVTTYGNHPSSRSLPRNFSMSHADSFEKWIDTLEHRCFQEWGRTAIEMGASWSSFESIDKTAIVDDLVKGGIPMLAARDMVDIASTELRKGKEPMAIFWDLENMQIPAGISGRDIASSIKSCLALEGDLVQFRGYASIGLNDIQQTKRSDLQLSGCHLVDCPHNGRKEVADKMILVDAMEFAYQNPNGATLCFISGDEDYAYLLAKLKRPQWKTIVITRDTTGSMLHVNCDVKMRWGIEVPWPAHGMSSGDIQEKRNDEQVYEPVEAADKRLNDSELLISVMKQLSQKNNSIAIGKSLVWRTLRDTHQDRFPKKKKCDIKIKEFLDKAIKEGVVIRHREGKTIKLSLPESRKGLKKKEMDKTITGIPSRIQGTGGDSLQEKYNNGKVGEPVEAADEKLNNSELLTSVMKRLSQKNDSIAINRSLVCNALRDAHRDRFPKNKKGAIKRFLDKLIKKGVVVQHFEGTAMKLSLPESRKGLKKKEMDETITDVPWPINERSRGSSQERCDDRQVDEPVEDAVKKLDDSELLTYVMKRLSQMNNSIAIHRSLVCNALRLTHVNRFREKNMVKEFIDMAIKNGVLIEHYSPNNKSRTLSLPESRKGLQKKEMDETITDVPWKIHEMSGGSLQEKCNGRKVDEPFEATDENLNDVELLTSVMKRLSQMNNSIAIHGGLLSEALRFLHINRFYERDMVKEFLDMAIKKGVLVQDTSSRLSLTESRKGQKRKAISEIPDEEESTRKKKKARITKSPKGSKKKKARKKYSKKCRALPKHRQVA